MNARKTHDGFHAKAAPAINSEASSLALLHRCSGNTPTRSLTESLRVEKNPVSRIDRPSIAAEYARRRQSAEHEGSRFQAGIAALIRVVVLYSAICFGARRVPAQDSSPR
jgi:hypothetical protein